MALLSRDGARTAREQPVVRRVDHVMIRAGDPVALFELLTGKLGLPAGQAPMTHPGGFTNAAVGIGNSYLECIRFGPGADSGGEPRARLWGIAFEPAAPLDESRARLKARGVPHAAPQVFERPDGEGRWQKMWTTLLFGVLKGGWKTRAAFSAQRLFGGIQQRQMRRMAEAASRGEATRGMDERRLDSMNEIIGHGWTFLCEYDADFVDPAKLRDEAREGLAESGGGPLGVARLGEVVVGDPEPEAARGRWANLLSPATPGEPGLWRLGDGPSIRIVGHPVSRLVALVFEVDSLGSARAFLEGEGMLGEAPEGEIRLLPAAVGGLDLRLVPRREGGEEG